MKTRLFALAAAVLLILSACTAAPETTQPETTQPQTTAPETSAAPDETFTAEAAQPGYYLVSSVGQEGDVTFYSQLAPENGWLKLEADHTGYLSFGGDEGSLTWDGSAVYWQGQTLPCMQMTYYDPELGRDDSMVMLYFLDTMTSVALRPAEEPAE